MFKSVAIQLWVTGLFLEVYWGRFETLPQKHGICHYMLKLTILLHKILFGCMIVSCVVVVVLHYRHQSQHRKEMPAHNKDRDIERLNPRQLHSPWWPRDSLLHPSDPQTAPYILSASRQLLFWCEINPRGLSLEPVCPRLNEPAFQRHAPIIALNCSIST